MTGSLAEVRRRQYLHENPTPRLVTQLAKTARRGSLQSHRTLRRRGHELWCINQSRRDRFSICQALPALMLLLLAACGGDGGGSGSRPRRRRPGAVWQQRGRGRLWGWRCGRGDHDFVGQRQHSSRAEHDSYLVRDRRHRVHGERILERVGSVTGSKTCRWPCGGHLHVYAHVHGQRCGRDQIVHADGGRGRREHRSLHLDQPGRQCGGHSALTVTPIW